MSLIGAVSRHRAERSVNSGCRRADDIDAVATFGAATDRDDDSDDGAGVMTRYRSHDVLGIPPGAPAADARRAHARLAEVFEPARWSDRPEVAAAAADWRRLVDDALADHLAATTGRIDAPGPTMATVG
jgi:hypothetical protein